MTDDIEMIKSMQVITKFKTEVLCFLHTVETGVSTLVTAHK
jgi:hypothetical protein